MFVSARKVLNARSPRGGRGGLPAPTRRGALLLCAAFLAFSILSSAFVVTHAAHRHDGHGVGGACATCAHISTIEGVLKQLTATAACFAVVVSAFAAYYTITRPMRFEEERRSPILLKVRLNY
jgi:hypothetical protein